jgi:hypothetical protein
MDAKISSPHDPPGNTMKLLAIAITCAGIAYALTACQRNAGSTAAAVSEPYRADIENLCDALIRSGATQLPAGDRALAIATWLSGHLTTREAHDYLVTIQPLVGEPKAVALETEARRVGLSHCALAAEWRVAKAP